MNRRRRDKEKKTKREVNKKGKMFMINIKEVLCNKKRNMNKRNI
jgi:hypothetical protein